ncbi:MAG: DUF892 family protein [Coriobacteriia bacterium]
MVMESKDAIDKISDLMRLDVDAVRAYNDAIEKIEVAEIRDQLGKYRDDHQRHVSDLTQVLQNMGAEIPEHKPDFKGLLLEGMTRLRSAMGTEQALKAMRQNEQITNTAYENAMEWSGDISPTVHDVVRRGFDDERRHLAYIEQQLTVSVGARGDY